jgi:hypothetical protein
MSTEPTMVAEATRLASDALEDLGLTAVMDQAGDSTLTPAVIAAVLDAVIPRVRADERERCLQAVRTLPPAVQAIYSLGYRQGHVAAQAEIIDRIEQLPLIVAIEG